MSDVYVPPAGGGGSETGCSGGCQTHDGVRITFIRSYLNAHMLSMSSHRYIYITWLVVVAVCIVLSACYHLGIADQSILGAAWSRFALKNRVIKLGGSRGTDEKKGVSIRKQFISNPLNTLQQKRTAAAAQQRQAPQVQRKRRKVLTFPSFGRILLLLALLLIPTVLTIIGADYIRPSAGVFDMSESFPETNISVFTPGLYRRESVGDKLQKRVLYGLHHYPPVTLNAPNITLPYKTWWTAGGRVGAMTNGLTPFIVILALKQIPFALFSTKLLGGVAFDRLSFLHKWGGRVVWLFATLHVVLWSVQLSIDHGFGGTMWTFIFLWTKFRWGFVSYIFLSILILLSVEPIRLTHYEVFYVVHVICVIGFMVAAWLHHPPLAAWMYVALLWWLAERVTRVVKVAYINGVGRLGKAQAASVSPSASVKTGAHGSAHSFSTHDGGEWRKHAMAPSYSMSSANGYSGKRDMYDDSHSSDQYISNTVDSAAIPMAPMNTKRYSLRDDGVDSSHMHDGSAVGSTSSSDHDTTVSWRQNGFSRKPAVPRPLPRPAIAADVAAVLRPGYAYVQLLPGKALRLTLRTPNAFAWKPGQYVQLNIPRVRWIQTHPFTIASAYQAEDPSSAKFNHADTEKGVSRMRLPEGEERTIVLLLRARGGFTNKLWDHVRVERERQIRHIEETTGMQYIHGQVAKTATGVHLRALIDGPYGSSQRTRFGIHSTVVIICGGSGVSYGLSVLEHLCATLAGLRSEKGFKTQRVRFVWILREFSHLQWISSGLRRCIELVPPQQLQVDLYVTSPQYASRALKSHNHRQPSQGMSASQSQDKLVHSHDYSNHGHSVDTSYGGERLTDGTEQDEYDIQADDLVAFDGEDISAPTAAEARINERVHREGKLRRAHTRRATQKRAGGRGPRQDRNRNKQAIQEAEALASQQAIYDGTAREVRPWSPQPPMPKQGAQASYFGHRDLSDGGHGGLAYHQETSHDDDGYMSPTESPQQGPSYVRSYSGNSLAPSAAYARGADQSYFNHSRPYGGRMPSSGQLSTQMPVAPSPMGTPRPTYSQYPSFEDKQSAEGFYSGATTPYGAHQGQSHHATPMASSTHLNQYPDGPDSRPHGRSGLAQEAFNGGSDLESVPSAPADAPIDLDEAEMTDMAIIAELARPGYPKLDRIVKQESDTAVGRVLVTSCGPSSLGDLIRSIVSKQIDLSAIRAGKLNRHINVATESYDWGG